MDTGVLKGGRGPPNPAKGRARGPGRAKGTVVLEKSLKMSKRDENRESDSEKGISPIFLASECLLLQGSGIQFLLKNG